MPIKISFNNLTSSKAIVLGVYEGNKFPQPTQAWNISLNGFLETSLKNSKFEGKLNQILSVFAPDGRQIHLVGLGRKENQNEGQWQKIGASLIPALEKSPNGEGSVEIHGLEGPQDCEVAANIAFGAFLKSWRFEKYFTTKPKAELFSAKALEVVTPKASEAKKEFETYEAIADGVFLTRTLVTEPSNVMNTEAMAEAAVSLKKDGVKVEVLEKKDLEKLGMNALLGVAQGSAAAPKVVVMHWEGGEKGKAPLAFVGKGVTFDTGGISIKPAAGMEEMKYDMGGAGVVVGLMKTLARRKAKANVVGVIGLVENMPSGTAQRPGDVVKSMSGQTIEVINTDAEGRLVLADALWYTQDRFKPEFMIDLATLTGAMVIMLGSEMAGLFTSSEPLGSKLLKTGTSIGEKLWLLPTDDVYDKPINSEIADMRNATNSREAGSITAAKFLQRFTNKVPWAHLDIAGVTWTQKDLPFCAKGATGFGVRLLDQFVADNYEG